MKVKMEYELSCYVKPELLNWTLEGIKLIAERYSVNIHEIKIKTANRANPYRKKAHLLKIMVWVDSYKVLPYITRRLEKEIGVLK